MVPQFQTTAAQCLGTLLDSVCWSDEVELLGWLVHHNYCIMLHKFATLS